MKYFIIQHENQLGPYSIEDLSLAKIDKNTLVWHEGLSDWTKAAELDELNELFVSKAKMPPPMPETEKKVPPPPPNSSTKSNYIPPKKEFTSKLQKPNYLLYIGGAILLLAILFFVSRQRNSSNRDYNNLKNNSNSEFSENKEFDESETNNIGESNSSENSSQESSYNSSPNVNKPREKSEYELREDLKAKEEKKPLKYLNVDYKLEYKVFTGEDKITGNVYNTATVADFTNVEIEITCSNSFDVFLGSEIFYLDGIVNADNYTQFSTKVKSPSGTKKIGLKVISATKVSYD